jgi:type I restriction enzyme S subunit
MAGDWEKTTLGAEVDLLTGFPFKSERYTDSADSIPLVRGDNIVQGAMRWDGVKRWPLSERCEHSLYELREGDVVLAMDRPWIEAGLKYAAISKHDLPCLLVQRTARLRGGPRLDTRFLRYLIGSREFTQHIHAITTGTAVPHISGKQIKDFKFTLPPLAEQKAIAAVLRALDDKIELNRRMNATLEAIARALFLSWFVDFDPVRAKLDGRQPVGMDSATAALFPAHFDHKAEGVVPTGWRATTLSEVIEILDSKRIPLSGREREARKGKYPYHGAASVMDYVDDYLFDGIYTLMGEDGSVINEDGTPVLQYVWGKFWVNNHAHVLRGKNGISTEHLLLHLKGCNIAPFVNGAVQPKLNQGNMNRIPFMLPPPEIGKAFAMTIAPLFAQIRINTEQSRKLATLRDTLLPKLLSGEIQTTI